MCFVFPRTPVVSSMVLAVFSGSDSYQPAGIYWGMCYFNAKDAGRSTCAKSK